MSVPLSCRLVAPGEWKEQRFQLLRFVRRHGEKKITAAAWSKMLQSGGEEWSLPGTACAVAYTQGGCPAGVAYAENYGDGVCLVAVHPALRGRGIGRSLMGKLAEPWGRLSCKVAADNPASLAMCFAAGFVATGIETGPTGKATLLMTWNAGKGAATPDGRVPALPAGR